MELQIKIKIHSEANLCPITQHLIKVHRTNTINDQLLIFSMSHTCASLSLKRNYLFDEPPNRSNIDFVYTAATPIHHITVPLIALFAQEICDQTFA